MNLRRALLILRHPFRWTFGACFICGTLMYFDECRLVGNARGFCYYHGESGSGHD